MDGVGGGGEEGRVGWREWGWMVLEEERVG